MRTLKIQRVIALATLLIAAGPTGLGYTNDSPSSESIAFAQRASDRRLDELRAALCHEVSETTPNGAEEGNQGMSLICNDSNRDMRLIGIFPPLQGVLNDIPSDLVEQKALALALRGQATTSVE